MESVAFGRIAAQQAKQVIVQKVREAERAQVVDAYQDRVNQLVSGVVKRVDRNGIYVDLGGNAEGFVPRTDMIPREIVKPQDRIKALLKEVKSATERSAARCCSCRVPTPISSSNCSSSKCRKWARGTSRSSAPRATPACAPRSR